MAWVIYPAMKEAMLDTSAANEVDFEGDDIRLMLVTSAFAYSAAHDFVDDIVANEVSGTNYARKALASEAVTLSTATVTFDAADTGLTYSQSSAGFSDARTAVLYRHVSSSDSANALIAYNTFSANQNNVSGDLTLQFSASGIFTLA